MKSLHLLQAHYWDSPLSIISASKIVERKCWNMRHLLDQYYSFRKNIHSEHAPVIRRSCQFIFQIEQGLVDFNDRRALLLYEGRATRSYWRSFALIAKCPLKWMRYYPHAEDPWNRALNIGYTLLLNLIREKIIKHGLSSEIGLLHTPRRGHDALIYDMQELYRQPLIDAAIMPLFSRKNASQTLSDKRTISSVLHHCDTQIKYRGKWWDVRAVIDAELDSYIFSLKKQVVFIPYQHSWSHWVRK